MAASTGQAFATGFDIACLVVLAMQAAHGQPKAVKLLCEIAAAADLQTAKRGR